MKKKLFAVLVFALFASLAFAQYGPPPSYGRTDQPPRHGGGMDFATYLSVNFVVPFQWMNMSCDDYGYDLNGYALSLGAGIDLTSFFTRHIGLHVSADFFFPQIGKSTYSFLDGSSFTSNVYNMQDYYDSSLELSVFAGPSFALIRTSRILFALAPGFRYYMLFAEKEPISAHQYTIGIGANAEFMFNVTRFVFLRAAVDITWDFWGTQIDYIGPSTYYSSVDYVINVAPQVGVGIKL